MLPISKANCRYNSKPQGKILRGITSIPHKRKRVNTIAFIGPAHLLQHKKPHDILCMKEKDKCIKEFSIEALSCGDNIVKEVGCQTSEVYHDILTPVKFFMISGNFKSKKHNYLKRYDRKRRYINDSLAMHEELNY